MRDDEIGIQDLEVVIARDVAGGHRAGAALVQTDLGHVAGVHADRDGLEIEQDVDHVLLHTLDRGVLVQHALDLDLGDRGTRQ